MASDSMRTSRIVALALVVGTFFTAQEVLMDFARGRPELSGQDVLNGLEFWVVWALLTPAVLMAVRSWPVDAKPVDRPLAAHAVVAIGLAVLQSVITIGLRSLADHFRSDVGLQDALARNASPTAFVWGVFTGVVFYSMIVMVHTAWRFRGRAVALEVELTRSKLDTLRSQLRPHFLFNTLNAISVFVTEDADKAQQMLLRLSTLLRRSLDEEAHEVTLGQELAFLNDYLEIQRGRFGDQLAVNLAVDPAAMEAYVPVFLLQPLLENAIEHGKSDDGCTTIALRADRERDVLHVTLADDGPGVSNGVPMREGVGLRNTRARLHHLYGSRATVDIRAAHGTVESPGTCVEIRIPFRATAG
jgi:hypothetical protein